MKQNLLAEIETVRARIRACDEECARIETAPVPLAEALERLDRFLDVLVARWKPHTGAFFAPAAFVPGDQRRVQLVPDPVRFHPAPREASAIADVSTELDFVGCLGALLRNQLREAWCRAIKESVPRTTAIALADRPKLLEPVRARRHDLEMDEERLIRQAEAAGLEVDRRDDCDPAICVSAVFKDEAA